MNPLPLNRRHFVQLGAAALAGAPLARAIAVDPPATAVPAGPTAFPGGQTARVLNGYTTSIWNDGHHNGFPGIARVGDFYYVTFRSAESHQATESKIRVIRAPAQDL